MFADQMDLLQKMRRREAIAERRVKGIKFVIGNNNPDVKVKSNLKGLRHEVVDTAVEQDEDEKEMSVIMGFSKFGHQKPVAETSTTIAPSTAGPATTKPKSRTFDIDKLVQESVHIARTTCAGVPAVDSQDDDDSAGPLPGTSHDESEEEELVGPPLPPGFSPPQSSPTGRLQDSDLSDSEEEDGECRYSRIPATSEISLLHGSKNISALAGKRPFPSDMMTALF